MKIEILGTKKNKNILLNKINGKWFFKSKDTLKQLIDKIANNVYIKFGRIPHGTCNIILCDDTEPIQRRFYGKVVHKNAPAFASLSRNAIVVNVDRCNKKILSHELGHIAFESFLKRRIGYDFHEMIAQYCEKS